MEWLVQCSEKGDYLKKVPRSLCHQGSFILHPVVHLHLIDAEGNFLLQKRSRKKSIQPGKWDTAVGGHVLWGETTPDTLKRESLEEIGFFPLHYSLIKRYLWETEQEKEFVTLFCGFYSGERLVFPPDEIEELKFWKREEITSQSESVSQNLLYEIGSVFTAENSRLLLSLLKTMR